MQLFSADVTMFLKKIYNFFAHKKLKKPPSKVAQNNSNSKMWPIDHLYIELGRRIVPAKQEEEERVAKSQESC